MKNKNYIYYIFAGAFVVLVVILMINGDQDKLIDDDRYIDIGDESRIVPSSTPEVTLAAPSYKPTKIVKPTPTLIFEEITSYSSWVKELDPDSRRMSIANDECSAIVPSNVTYSNNTKVMLDNSFSNKDHILKIGNQNYSLEAGEWIIVTLYSPQLPVKLPIYCGSIELGQIDLQ